MSDSEERPPWDALPQKQGMYDPEQERDACGVACIVQIDRKPMRQIIEDARVMLCRMQHRAGMGAVEADGDGCGIQMGIPDELFRSFVPDLPPKGEYGVGNLFLPHSDARSQHSLDSMKRAASQVGLQILALRDVPVDSSFLGPYAKSTEPRQVQIFVGRIDPQDSGEGSDNEKDPNRTPSKTGTSPSKIGSTPSKTGRPWGKPRMSAGEGGSASRDSNIRRRRDNNTNKNQSLEILLFLMRRGVSARNRELYVCSLSCKTITYKGQLSCGQLFRYYSDLTNPLCMSHCAMVHSRFSTNSFPSWQRAHPFRRICHNGEINTLEGNRNALRGREAAMKCDVFNVEAALPVDEEVGGDSSLLDNMVEMMGMAGRDLAEVMMMLVPEPWQNDVNMPEAKRSFYQYNSMLVEPWDGPALVAFCDGDQFGATLDRNGLRPGRWLLTKDRRVILSSEVGVVDVPEELVERKSRLMPGKMLLVDFNTGELVEDEILKHKYATKHPFKEWIEKESVDLNEVAQRVLGTEPMTEADIRDILHVEDADIITQGRMFGYTSEKLEMLVYPMAKSHHEALGSMGTDIPLACLSRLPRRPFEYFYQLFAQATNPAIDPLRESNVMSLVCPIGPEGNLLAHDPISCRRLVVPAPLLDPLQFAVLTEVDDPAMDNFAVAIVDMTYDKPEEVCQEDEKTYKGLHWRARAFKAIKETTELEERIDQVKSEAEASVRTNKVGVIVLSHRSAGPGRIPISSLLAVGAVHHHLLANKLRSRVAIVVECGDCAEIHEFAMLVGFGADAVYPYLCYASLVNARSNNPLPQLIENFREGAHAGILKVMAKMGISCLQSYKGAQLFQAVGISSAVIKKCFCGVASTIDGVGFDILHDDATRLHRSAYPNRPLPPLVAGIESLPDWGDYHFRSVADSEIHVNSPDAIAQLQSGSKDRDSKASKDAYDKFAEYHNKVVENSDIRGQFEFCFDDCESIPIENVEPASELLKRFATGAMSLGSISEEAHSSLGEAMNNIGGKSNTGEGGEAIDRRPGSESRIRQVASGRFGVTGQYLASADEIQIKLAQGAKPGEGGELPGYKVVGKIAETRKSTPGVGLISPPPHHDMYSIEDVAQLISDLKHANPKAEISIKLVSRIGVGIIAAGVTKCKADRVLISGMSGGTGAAKWTSIKHCGLPWEIGLAETHQTLVVNGLRDRVKVQVDGNMRTGKDAVYAALLGAEEVCMSTAPLIVLGCIMMRKCHLNTCPVGIATQDPELRKKFEGQPEHVINYFFKVAEEMREIMAQLGVPTWDELVGRVDLLRPRPAVKQSFKTAQLNFAGMLRPAWTLESVSKSEGQRVASYCTTKQDHKTEEHYDEEIWAKMSKNLGLGMEIEVGKDRKAVKPVELFDLPVSNQHRQVGAQMSYRITKAFGAAGLPEGTVKLNFIGHGGLSFGAFLAPGVTFDLVGDSNDYIGKGLSGGNIIVRKPKESSFDASINVIGGNACLYGATAGTLYGSGVFAERFAVRNSGVTTVVEGIGDHGCEYMTRGLVVVLGPIGKNFAAGMSGGIAYLFDAKLELINQQMVYVERVTYEDKQILKFQLQEHLKYTQSAKAAELLADWENTSNRFRKVFPMDYKRVLRDALVEHVTKDDKEAARVLDGFENMRLSAAGATGIKRDLNDGLRDKYKVWRSKDKGISMLPALGLGDAYTHTSDMMPNAQGDENMVQLFRQGYMMWRKGHHKGASQAVKGSITHRERSDAYELPMPELSEEALGQIKWVSSQGSLVSMNRCGSDASLELCGASDEGSSGTDGGRSTPKTKVLHPSVLAEKLPIVPAKVAKKTATFDMEDVIADQTKKPKRPTAVAFPDKKLGFHLYDRQTTTYRTAATRIHDWDEIFESGEKKASRVYHKLLKTQSSRCMDCGTPSCSFPNQQGGGCPLGNRIPTWNSLVHEGDWKRALERLLDTNNFPEFTGTTCPAPCEEACVLGINEAPVAIKSIEMAIIDQGYAKGWVKPQKPLHRTGKRVVIIGSGPCGLAAAQQLNRAGNLVKVLERADRCGGLLVYGIPQMKLNKDKVERRIDLLRAEGIEFETGVSVGQGDLSIAALCDKYDAVVLATGSTKPRGPGVLGHSKKGVYQAMDFLVQAQKSYLDSDMEDGKFIDAADKDVVVLGGGDTAVDCLGTAIRMGAKSVVQFSRREKAEEGAWQAGASGKRPLRTPWPGWADVYRVDYAHSEAPGANGDPRTYSVRAAEIMDDPKQPGKVCGVKAMSVKLANGRVTDVAGSEKIYKADLVLVALGFEGPEALNGVALDKRGNFDANYGAYKVEGERSSNEDFANLFAGGDCRRGASLVVTAIAEGRDLAYRVDEWLNGETSLPRCAPLIQNPALYKPEIRTRNKKEIGISAEIEKEFSRGLVGEASQEGTRRFQRPPAEKSKTPFAPSFRQASTAW